VEEALQGDQLRGVDDPRGVEHEGLEALLAGGVGVEHRRVEAGVGDGRA
jgi:hypothetical protein